jgi:hypothetical protein
MIAKKTFSAVCGFALLSAVASAQVISTPNESLPAVDPPADVHIPKSAHPESDRLARNILINLRIMGGALLQVAADNEGPLPDHLGRIVSEVPSVEVFVTPGTHVPAKIRNGSSMQQSLWVQQHSSYAFPAHDKNINALHSHAIILHERLDLEPSRPWLGVFFADGSVEMIDRGALEFLLRQP